MLLIDWKDATSQEAIQVKRKLNALKEEWFKKRIKDILADIESKIKSSKGCIIHYDSSLLSGSPMEEMEAVLNSNGFIVRSNGMGGIRIFLTQDNGGEAQRLRLLKETLLNQQVSEVLKKLKDQNKNCFSLIPKYSTEITLSPQEIILPVTEKLKRDGFSYTFKNNTLNDSENILIVSWENAPVHSPAHEYLTTSEKNSIEEVVYNIRQKLNETHGTATRYSFPSQGTLKPSFIEALRVQGIYSKQEEGTITVAWSDTSSMGVEAKKIFNTALAEEGERLEILFNKNFRYLNYEFSTNVSHIPTGLGLSLKKQLEEKGFVITLHAYDWKISCENANTQKWGGASWHKNRSQEDYRLLLNGNLEVSHNQHSTLSNNEWEYEATLDIHAKCGGHANRVIEEFKKDGCKVTERGGLHTISWENATKGKAAHRFKQAQICREHLPKHYKSVVQQEAQIGFVSKEFKVCFQNVRSSIRPQMDSIIKGFKDDGYTVEANYSEYKERSVVAKEHTPITELTVMISWKNASPDKPAALTKKLSDKRPCLMIDALGRQFIESLQGIKGPHVDVNEAIKHFFASLYQMGRDDLVDDYLRKKGFLPEPHPEANAPHAQYTFENSTQGLAVDLDKRYNSYHWEKFTQELKLVYEGIQKTAENKQLCHSYLNSNYGINIIENLQDEGFTVSKYDKEIWIDFADATRGKALEYRYIAQGIPLYWHQRVFAAAHAWFKDLNGYVDDNPEA